MNSISTIKWADDGRQHGRVIGISQGADANPPRVTICAIVKNEGAFLLEWVAYYRLMGIERFVIYNNGSTDDTRAVLDRIAGRAGITVIDWPSTPNSGALSFFEARDLVLSLPHLRDFNWWGDMTVGPQLRAYNHFVTYYAAETDWALFIDADEFVVSRAGLSLPALAASYGEDPAVGAVALNWRYFGSSGHRQPDGRLVIERFTRCAPTLHPGHVHMKSLVRTAALDRMLIHSGRLRQGHHYVDDTGTPVALRDFAFTPAISHSRLYIHHYSVKSRAEFERKRARGRAPFADGHPHKGEGLDDAYFRRQDLNDEADLLLLHQAPAVKAEMARLLG
ncbi:glycosyltransferase family 2 protein [Nitrospirillum sp. BR 11164]|uniref:glycosyltransferase family 2 protein n=1 Tax=Nitrospirillum sp. BR 11164 TaxID=3104324 RepID=UPI002AFDEC26|nr:glycosyltransferase family 2 protein [Nitrospirillum sp. BR 11164]MEA1651326.1 glycosyltransferase family 2 protein [Nitrospirillum sp. BR 11164]